MTLDLEYRLDSRYLRGIEEPAGKVFLSGQQALVRLLLAQAAADRAAGINSAGFVSGYRGSPLGGLDQELWRVRPLLEKANIRFQPAINEDLAATTLIGTQRVESDAARLHDGIFGLWYGKGPGVDRSGDALKHGNAYGSSPHGGVLVVTGDDHGCVSSSMSHQSDQALMAWGLPVIHPVGLADYEYCGLWGWALSRCCGLWVGFKAVTETVEASRSVDAVAAPRFVAPAVDPGPDGLHWRWPDLPGMQIERRFSHKIEAARRFIRANPLDRVEVAPAFPRLLIAAVGKAYGDVREALERGGVSLGALEKAGVALLSIRVVYPLSPVLEAWARRCERVLIIEEKQGVVEDQLKRGLFNAKPENRPLIIGKLDERGQPLLSVAEELRPSRIMRVLSTRLAPFGLAIDVPRYWIEGPVSREFHWLKRTPYLCSGCPHNTSTQLPEGSEARLGIGCHALAARMPDRATSGSVQMGGEGVDWLGQMAFVATPHIFQNMGDGTFFHSGYLAIRQAIAANANITYKVLYNDAVAMTGGQPVDGKLSVRQVVELVLSEGVREVVVVADDPSRYKARDSLPDGVKVYHRDTLDSVQRRLRELPGVSVLVFDQVCATEARRRRKRLPPAKVQSRVVINQQVCEGCGDCQTKSNCLSVVPVETEFGRKRSIDTDSCNLDQSCVKGFCPSFVTVTGTPAKARRKLLPAEEVLALAGALATPEPAGFERTFELLITGVGGTGVVTMAGTIAMAAHLQGLEVSVLDFTGFAQKGGSVFSHIRFAHDPQQLHQHRIDRACADVLIASDLAVASEDEALNVLLRGRSRVVASTSEVQAGAMLLDPALRLETAAIEQRLIDIVGAERYQSVDARKVAAAVVGPMQANILLLGVAWQQGVVPLTLSALDRSLEIYGGDVQSNRLAFAWGRLLAADPAFVESQLKPASAAQPPQALTLEQVVQQRSALLVDYQDQRYAARYRALVEQVVKATEGLGDVTLAHAVAHNLFKLMAFKDEYEVARLHSSPAFLSSLGESFVGRPKVTFHLAPPFLDGLVKRTGEPRKIKVSGWIIPVFRALAGLRFLRHTVLDPFGLLKERREEQRLLEEYQSTLIALLPKLTADTLPMLVSWARLPEAIRGYGHVKARSIGIAEQRQVELLAQIDGRQVERSAVKRIAVVEVEKVS
ncbi:indolepyruvate ferredoxin oxidoreductase family protein [Pseudomonas sp. ChxA]|uniref:Indolepyruvate ferredoxin oxidoreductase family protein n=1 Tax=Pseudomonas fluorescens TaxID=294 RepID=A0A2T0HRR9_PSEFL|nr:MULTISPECIES: indolepyruvate ferredoxin oxidoreductase family protein [Pseudomonas]AOA05108.1 2-oxoacid ferredoxin oxidoreductase [Pseudomonas sp. TMW 2.1634]MDL2185899.1 indolepyruvate ferredoxin oxidoreductase family protein [Pseudomonas sp. ChxA]OOW02148.1 2-oxoacid ferredoxin oxidoreductase [Pseudomonas sp. MF6394]PRW85812.1 indolepyruvate ferredoxin oxidoreductase family protein [Pseudomonas fluorescens]TPV55890.1 indolepyruvate ferredoxin oxidoreductase family protein [Pseudomonas flu